MGNPYGKAFVDALGGIPEISAPVMPQAHQATSAKHAVNWAGILEGVLAGAMGRPSQFAAMNQQQRQAEMEDAQWTRRQASMLQDYAAKQAIESQYRRDPIADGVDSFLKLTPEQRAAYKEMHPGQSDIVTVTLPGNRIYSGPRDGLAAALSGMGSAGQSGIPAAPVGGLTPMTGGPTPPASGGFRR